MASARTPATAKAEWPATSDFAFGALCMDVAITRCDMRTALWILFSGGLVLAVCGCPGTGQDPLDSLLIFHNGTGPMCIEALNWLAEIQAEEPDLVVEQHLTTDPASLALLGQLRLQYGQSQGVSTTFGYLPFIFFRGEAFSGFSEGVKQSLTWLIESIDASAP